MDKLADFCAKRMDSVLHTRTFKIKSEEELPAMPTADAGCLRCRQLTKLGLRLHAELASQGMRRVRPHLDPSWLESGARNEVLWSLDQGTSH